MSAISGMLWFHGAPAQTSAIEDLVARCASFGPDEQKFWISGPVALGHCMLRTTPEAAGEHLPVLSDDGRYCLVWDGRLDNREELRRHLLARGMRLRSDTDSELVLNSYIAWGRECPSRLMGDFAFALWDAREQRLFCIRDHTGARPLYWAKTEQFFAFASHEEALLGLAGVTAKPYEAGIARIFVPGICLPEDAEANFSRTWYDNVRFVLAGQFAEIATDGRLQFQTYWKPEPGSQVSYRSDHECRDAFLEVFGAATRDRLRASGDIAVLMSGGLDTAGIVAMARRHLGQRPQKQLHAYSVVSDDPRTCIESQSILSMAKGMADRFHAVSAPSFGGAARVEDLLAQAWPHSHPEDNDLWLQAVLCQLASQNGHRVILQGAHGDIATWAPMRYIACAMRGGHWRAAWHECRAASANHNFLCHRSALRLWAENSWSAWAPAGLKFALHALRVRGPALRLLNPDFAHSLGWQPERKPQTHQAAHEHVSVQQSHAQTLKSLSYSRSGIPRVAGRSAVETRDPWEDQRVLEFFLNLPTQFRVRDGWTKHLVRSSFSGDLDAQVLWRRGKQHLGWDVSTRVLLETHEQFQETLNDPSAECWKYLDPGVARERYQLYRAQNDPQAAQDMLNMMTLSTWLPRIRKQS